MSSNLISLCHCLLQHTMLLVLLISIHPVVRQSAKPGTGKKIIKTGCISFSISWMVILKKKNPLQCIAMYIYRNIGRNCDAHQTHKKTQKTGKNVCRINYKVAVNHLIWHYFATISYILFKRVILFGKKRDFAKSSGFKMHWNVEKSKKKCIWNYMNCPNYLTLFYMCTSNTMVMLI